MSSILVFGGNTPGVNATFTGIDGVPCHLGDVADVKIIAAPPIELPSIIQLEIEVNRPSLARMAALTVAAISMGSAHVLTNSKVPPWAFSCDEPTRHHHFQHSSKRKKFKPSHRRK